MVALNIRDNVRIWQELNRTADPEMESEANEPTAPQYQFGHIYLGSRQKRCKLGDFKDSQGGDCAFQDLQACFDVYLNEERLRSQRCSDSEPALPAAYLLPSLSHLVSYIVKDISQLELNYPSRSWSAGF